MSVYETCIRDSGKVYVWKEVASLTWWSNRCCRTQEAHLKLDWTIQPDSDTSVIFFQECVMQTSGVQPAVGETCIFIAISIKAKMISIVIYKLCLDRWLIDMVTVKQTPREICTHGKLTSILFVGTFVLHLSQRTVTGWKITRIPVPVPLKECFDIAYSHFANLFP